MSDRPHRGERPSVRRRPRHQARTQEFRYLFGGKGVDPDPAPSPNKTFNSILLKAEGPKMATREAAKSMTSQQNTTRN